MTQNKEEKDLGTTRIYSVDKAILEGLSRKLEAASGLEATAPRVLRLALKAYEISLSNPGPATSSTELAAAIALLCQLYHRDSDKVRRIATNLQEELTHYEDTAYDTKEATAKSISSAPRKRKAR